MINPEPDPTAVHEIEQAAREALADEYQIERVLGQGGMSVVFLAEELVLKRAVALKVFPQTLSLGASAADRFRHEARIAASLEHPHIAPIHRFGVAPGFLWYTMKYINGGSLADTLRDVGRLDRFSVLSLTEQAASALDYAHRHGVIHRDMKPANVMLDESNWAYVCDFGVAKVPDTKLTQTGGTIGTPAYMSPEQLYGRSLDARSDQYSLGVMVFELLAGRHPFVADSVADIIHMHCSVTPPALSEFRPDLPERLVQGVARAMSKKPEDRFDSVIEFLTAIGGRRPPQPPQPRVSIQVAEAVTERLPTTPAPPRRRRVAPFLAGGLLGIALTGAALAFTPLGNLVRGGEPVAPFTPPSIPALGHVWINSEPWGALYIDGSNAGNTPALNIPLATGAHVIRIERDGYAPYERRFDLAPDQELRLTDIVLQRAP
jgi:serine/threonine-protein kinase